MTADRATTPPPPPSGRRRAAVGVGLATTVVAAGLSLWAIGYYAVTTLSFEPTNGAVWRGWQAAPFSFAGWTGLGLSAVAVVVWSLTRRRAPVAAVAVPVAVVAVIVTMVVVAARIETGRRHPVAGERLIAASLPLPSSWGPSRYEVIPESPPDIEPGPPRVDRVLVAYGQTTSLCDQLRAALLAWGATVTSTSTRADVSGRPSCYLAGDTPQGWSYIATVVPAPPGPATIGVEVYPPGQ